MQAGAGCGCPPRSRTDRMIRRGSMRLPACRRIIFAGFAAARFTPRLTISISYMPLSAARCQLGGFR